MPRTAVPTALRADKTLVRQVADFDEFVENAEDFIELMKTNAARGAAQKDVAALRKRMKSALEAADAREAAKLVAVLVKDARKCVDAAAEAMTKEIYERYMALWTRARSLLAQALIQVGALEPPALRLPLQKEQAELRARLDAIEREPNKTPGSIADVEALMPKVEALVKRLETVGDGGQWMRRSYLPLVARVKAAIQRVPADRCRKTLLAEIDFIEADTRKALEKADVKGIQARAVPQLQRIEKLAAQVVATSPSIDRELGRLAQRIQAAPSAAGALTKKLKALVEAKAKAWPAGADVDGIAKAMAGFEAQLAKLTAEIETAAKVPAKA